MTTPPITSSSLLSALSTLNNQSTPQKERRIVDLWLSDYQKTTEAWIISLDLLKDQSIEEAERVFWAQTIKLKVINDLNLIDSNEFTSLHSTLDELIGVYSRVKGGKCMFLLMMLLCSLLHIILVFI